MIILQYKASRDKMNTALISKNSWTYPKLGLNEHCSNLEKTFDISQTRNSHLRGNHVRFTQKHIMKFLPFQKNVIILQSKASREKMNTALTLNVLGHIPNCGFSFQSNTCVFLTKVCHEILSFSNERDYL